MRIPTLEVAYFKRDFLKTHPELKDEVEQLWWLLYDEIQDSEVSQPNEEQLFIEDCQQLLITET